MIKKFFFFFPILLFFIVFAYSVGTDTEEEEEKKETPSKKLQTDPIVLLKASSAPEGDLSAKKKEKKPRVQKKLQTLISPGASSDPSPAPQRQVVVEEATVVVEITYTKMLGEMLQREHAKVNELKTRLEQYANTLKRFQLSITECSQASKVAPPMPLVRRATLLLAANTSTASAPKAVFRDIVRDLKEGTIALSEIKETLFLVLAAPYLNLDIPYNQFSISDTLGYLESLQSVVETEETPDNIRLITTFIGLEQKDSQFLYLVTKTIQMAIKRKVDDIFIQLQKNMLQAIKEAERSLLVYKKEKKNLVEKHTNVLETAEKAQSQVRRSLESVAESLKKIEDIEEHFHQKKKEIDRLRNILLRKKKQLLLLEPDIEHYKNVSTVSKQANLLSLARNFLTFGQEQHKHKRSFSPFIDILSDLQPLAKEILALKKMLHSIISDKAYLSAIVRGFSIETVDFIIQFQNTVTDLDPFLSLDPSQNNLTAIRISQKAFLQLKRDLSFFIRITDSIFEYIEWELSRLTTRLMMLNEAETRLLMQQEKIEILMHFESYAQRQKYEEELKKMVEESNLLISDAKKLLEE